MKKIQIVIMTAVLLFLIGFVVSSISMEQNMKAKQTAWEQERELNNALQELIHCMWIDNPSYFEESLMETQEWQYADSIREHDWEDVFLFWSEQDSIEYHRNWNEGR